MAYPSKYDIDTLVLHIVDMDYFDMIQRCQSECKWAEFSISKLKRHDHDEKYHIQKYLDQVKDFLFYLNNGIIPHHTGKEGMLRFIKPLQKLVEKGQMKPEMITQLQ